MTLPEAELVVAAVRTFRCGHPSTPDNTYVRKENPKWGYCRTCNRESAARRQREFRASLPPKDMDRLEERMAALVANGRCEVCNLWRPCEHQSAASLAWDRQPITMPPPYNGD